MCNKADLTILFGFREILQGMETIKRSMRPKMLTVEALSSFQYYRIPRGHCCELVHEEHMKFLGIVVYGVYRVKRVQVRVIFL